MILFYLAAKQLAENKFKNGEALNLDILSLQANIDAEKNNKIDLESGLKKQVNLLNYITGTEKIDGKDFDFEIEDINPEAGISIAEQNNPVFKIAGDQIIQSKSEINIIKLQNKPSIAVNAATGIKNGYVPDVNELRFNYMAGVSFNFPIYSFGKTKQQIKLQESYVKQNELSKISLASTYKKDIEQAKVDFYNNTEKIKNSYSQIDESKAKDNDNPYQNLSKS
jgi:outer membrane protein TolC